MIKMTVNNCVRVMQIGLWKNNLSLTGISFNITERVRFSLIGSAVEKLNSTTFSFG